MGEVLYRPVGLGGTNFKDDTIKVQRRLVAKGYSLGTVDGLCGRRTIAAIVSFQGTFLRKPDGLIGPDGPTWQRLNSAAAAKSAPPVLKGMPPLPVAPPKPPVPQAKLVGKFTDFVPAPPKNTINIGLTPTSNKLMFSKLGTPRENFSADCLPVTNKALKDRLALDTIGPFRVTGLKPAVESLKLVFGDIRQKLPDMYNVLGTAGMLCCRYVRGSSTSISNHSWGTAIDLTINGVLDKRGDGKVQTGLVLLAPLFNARGWYWGAGFPTEDGMHFETSVGLLSQFGL